jgi:ketosteroid isomerase-like protein
VNRVILVCDSSHNQRLEIAVEIEAVLDSRVQERRRKHTMFYDPPSVFPVTASSLITCLDFSFGKIAMMRTLSAALLFVFSLNTWSQELGLKPLSSAEPGTQVRQGFLKAYNAKDVDAVVALYAEGATLVSDGGTFRGRDEIRNWVKSGVDQGSTLTIEPRVEKSSGTLAYGTGRTRRLVGSVVHLGRYLIVMQKIGGEWKIVEHFSMSVGEPDRDDAASTDTFTSYSNATRW